MAKKSQANASKEKYPFPSRFGSHAVMINEEKTTELAQPNLVVCADEYGDYITSRSQLDTGLADPVRYEVDRYHEFLAKSKKDKKKKAED